MKRITLVLLLIATAASAQEFMPVDYDATTGKISMRVGNIGQQFLYVVSLPAGVGSNPIGLDRDEEGESRLVHFERFGPKLLLVEDNPRFRALSNDANERNAVENSFAKSVLWGFTIDKTEGDMVTFNAHAFFLSDQHGVADRLRSAQQGNYSVDKNRS